MTMLATSISGKCVSLRHHYASQEKLTAGDAAKYISKSVGTKVLAKEVKSLYITYYGHEPEWHHSGFYYGNRGKQMGRTFFLSEEEAQTLAVNFRSILQERAKETARKEVEEARKRETMVTGFYWTWDYDYSGRYGKRQNFKVLHTYEGNELNAPARNFTRCDADTFSKVKNFEGKRYYGWDEPSIEDFN